MHCGALVRYRNHARRIARELLRRLKLCVAEQEHEACNRGKDKNARRNLGARSPMRRRPHEHDHPICSAHEERIVAAHRVARKRLGRKSSRSQDSRGNAGSFDGEFKQTESHRNPRNRREDVEPVDEGDYISAESVRHARKRGRNVFHMPSTHQEIGAEHGKQNMERNVPRVRKIERQTIEEDGERIEDRALQRRVQRHAAVDEWVPERSFAAADHLRSHFLERIEKPVCVAREELLAEKERIVKERQHEHDQHERCDQAATIRRWHAFSSCHAQFFNCSHGTRTHNYSICPPLTQYEARSGVHDIEVGLVARICAGCWNRRRSRLVGGVRKRPLQKSARIPSLLLCRAPLGHSVREVTRTLYIVRGHCERRVSDPMAAGPSEAISLAGVKICTQRLLRHPSKRGMTRNDGHSQARSLVKSPPPTAGVNMLAMTISGCGYAAPDCAVAQPARTCDIVSELAR
ncbi:MAG: hypothetical protein C4532_03925 [Candidatus Abyssobacteria bacterium SURF_17]|uniref:Uncharacterized protein n=1 Tax=Candidatus Abyssobacteria bacterium SURF_17 TaxID=2093361 RepID=A0A419F674_9BACT|nr:MAG: hypothetical protein C4532_03925 [Candidatus Abyssubacteria bacterium SURF_17]